MSDDDRIKFNSIEDINHILKKNNNLSGMTINHEPMLEIKKNIYKNKRIKIKIESFNIAKNAYQLGLNSAQIYNTKYFIQSIKFQKNIFNEAYYHTGVVLFLIATKKDWKYQKSKLIIYRYGVFNDKEKISYLKRLDDEFKGYLKPARSLFTKVHYKEIFNNIFYINILSWILFNIKLNGKNNTFKVLWNNLNFFPFSLNSILILIGIYILPLSLLDFLRKFKVIQKI